jgi:hypothetical protein
LILISGRSKSLEFWAGRVGELRFSVAMRADLPSLRFRVARGAADVKKTIVLSTKYMWEVVESDSN